MLFLAMLLAVLVFLTCLAPVPVSSSVAVYQWTPKTILIATDSLGSLIVEGQPKYWTRCKISQEKDVFFSVLGMTDFEIESKNKGHATTNKFDFVAAARKASREPGGIEAKISLFRKLALPEFERWWQLLLKHSPQLIGLIGNKVSLVMASRSEHSIAVTEFGGRTDGKIATVAQFFGTKPGQRPDTGYKALGIHEEGQAAALKDPALAKAEGVPFIVGFIEAQIQHEKYRRQTNQIERVGGPISVLQIVNGWAAWIRGYQGLCPDIS